MKKNHLAALGLTAGLVAGGAAGLALGVPHLAGAQAVTVAPPTTASGSTATPKPAAPDAPDGWMKETLDQLVAKGTITQAQADEVLKALQDARPAKGPGIGQRELRLGLDAAAGALGMTEDQLRTELQAGKSIADVATEKKVDLQKVSDAVLAAAKTEAAKAVADGKLTQTQADALIARLQTNLPKILAGDFPRGGPSGRGGPGFRGHGPKPADGSQPSGSTTTTTA